MKRNLTLSFVWLATLGVAVLAGCTKVVEKQEPIRLVRTITVSSAQTQTQLSFAGEVRARYETDLGFRVGGKLVSRDVEVGSLVRKGQTLARLDPKDLQLSVETLRANLNAAVTQRALAEADFNRFRELRAKNFISQAEFDRHQAELNTASDTVAAAQSQLSQARNQAGYAALVADHAGVVTAIEAEVGQVLAAGQTVVRVARLEEKEVTVSVPEQQVDQIKAAQTIDVTLWAKPDARYEGRVREVAPMTDRATRTYLVKVAVAGADDALRLGMTAEVSVRGEGTSALALLPLSALYTKTSAAHVWLVDPKSSTVRRVPIETGGITDNRVLVKSGLRAGDVVVTAGANLLVAGQKVRVTPDAPGPSARAESPSAPRTAP